MTYAVRRPGVSRALGAKRLRQEHDQQAADPCRSPTPGESPSWNSCHPCVFLSATRQRELPLCTAEFRRKQVSTQDQPVPRNLNANPRRHEDAASALQRTSRSSRSTENSPIHRTLLATGGLNVAPCQHPSAAAAFRVLDLDHFRPCCAGCADAFPDGKLQAGKPIAPQGPPGEVHARVVH